MEMELRLKELLQESNLYRYGIEQQIANETNLHRHTVGKLLRNQVRSPKLKVLGKICEWLVDNNVPAESLPGALFGFRAPGLWKAIGNSKSVRIYMGMYHHDVDLNSNKGRWGNPESLARGDAWVQARIIQKLSNELEMGDARPSVKTRYIPFKFSTQDLDVNDDWFAKDKARAGRIYKEMQDRAHYESAILLGSQRVNYVLEYLVANLFGCDPFRRPKGNPRIPFYLCYREFDRRVPSCFGGRENPPQHKEKALSGIYYLEKVEDQERWSLIECNHDKKRDAGIAIVIRVADTVTMALFGVSGRATAAVGNALIVHPEKFWPAPESGLEWHGGEISIYMCQVNFPADKADLSEEIEDWGRDKVVVIPLGRDVLKKYLNPNLRA